MICVFFSAVVNGAACGGRRRSFMRSLNDIGMPSEVHGLDSSLSDASEGDERITDGKSKNFLTIWTTSFSTKTVTAFATDTGATVSVSAYCSVAGNLVNGC